MLVTMLLVTSAFVGSTTAVPAQSAPMENGLTENESATLWSRDADQYRSQTHPAFQERENIDRTAIQQLATGTDITFTHPPATAGTWTQNDFEDLEAGDAATAVHPPHATLEDGEFITDAHATVFATQPSTRVHADADDPPLYLAPNGTLRGLVDYRVRVPEGEDRGTTTTDWSLVNHRIESVRLKRGDQTLSERSGTHTPALEYNLDHSRSTTLTLEADIHVRLRKTTRIYQRLHTDTRITYRTETRTVSDSIDVEIYNRPAYSTSVRYPNGDSGVAVFHSQPWQGYTLTRDGTTRVRSRWRFYTARDPRWETLVKSRQAESETVTSDAIPVSVHAYPSRIAPRVESERHNGTLLDTWGTERSSPAETIGENVTVGVVSQPYTATRGIAVRTDTVDQSALQVSGIVRGTTVPVRESTSDSTRKLRRSTLNADVIEQNHTAATLRIELTDAQTGAPIVLDRSSRRSPGADRPRGGVITVGDHRVETNGSGVAIVTLDKPGVYTVRYQPGSWLGHDPAYTSETAPVRWHPLGTFDGWVALLLEVGWRLIPVVVVLYAGHRLARVLGGRSRLRGKR